MALDSGDKGGGEEITVDGDDDEDDDDEDDEDNDDGGVEASVTDIDLNASQWDTPRAAKGAQSIGNKAPAWAADRAAAIAAAGAQGPLNGRVASGTLPETFQDSESGLCIVNAALYVDEWEDDDDVGYIYVQLTEDEFFEMMEEVGPPVHPLACQEGFFSPPSLSPSLSHTHTHTHFACRLRTRRQKLRLDRRTTTQRWHLRAAAGASYSSGSLCGGRGRRRPAARTGTARRGRKTATRKGRAWTAGTRA